MRLMLLPTSDELSQESDKASSPLILSIVLCVCVSRTV